MKPDHDEVDAPSFFQVGSWQCVRTANATAVARALGLVYYQPANVPQDLTEVEPDALPCLVVTHEGWTWVFGNGLGLRGATPLAEAFGECLALHIDANTGTYRCERAVDGQVVRRVYVSDRDQEFDSFGEPGAAEPQVSWLDGDGEARTLGLSAADVLAFARAWGARTEGLFEGHAPRAFLGHVRPFTPASDGGKRRSILATLVGAIVVLAVVAGLAAGAWWLVQSDQEEAAAQFCESQWSCASCVGCTSAPPHACAETYHACEEDEDCFALLRCLTSCQDLGTRAGFTAPGPAAETCFAECRETHANGLSAYCAFTECSYRTACTDLCENPGYQALSACE